MLALHNLNSMENFGILQNPSSGNSHFASHPQNSMGGSPPLSDSLPSSPPLQTSRSPPLSDSPSSSSNSSDSCPLSAFSLKLSNCTPSLNLSDCPLTTDPDSTQSDSAPGASREPDTVGFSKERCRSRTFRLSLAALIEEIRGIIDSPEVPATGLCKNKVLSFGVKYIVLKDILKAIPRENMMPSFNTTAFDQDSRCFIAFDSNLEIYYTSTNIAKMFTEPQSYVMKSNLSRYLSPAAHHTLSTKCSGNRDKISLMLSLKRAAKARKIFLKCKKYVMKTRTVWIGSCDMCSMSVSRVTEYTNSFFLDTHWSLRDLLGEQNNKELAVKRLEVVHLMGLLNGYFSVDLDLTERGILCKGITIYSDDNFPVFFAGTVFSFHKFRRNNKLSLHQSLSKQTKCPYPLGYSMDKHKRYMEFSKIFCNYVRLKHGNEAQIQDYLSLLLDPRNVDELLYETDLDNGIILDHLGQCFHELYEIHKTDLNLWRRLQGAIGYTVGDLVIKSVVSVHEEIMVT